VVEPVALINGAQVIRGKFVYKRFLSELPAPRIEIAGPC
jgi:hypothetical protein